MSGRRSPSAFTMIELVFVLVIISLTMALAAPSLSGWSDGAKLRDATDQFVAATTWARSQAIMNATQYNLTIDATTESYVITPADAQAAPAGEFARTTVMPSSFRIELASGGAGNSQIAFFPDSRVTPAVVRITSVKNEISEIGSANPAEPFRILVANR